MPVGRFDDLVHALAAFSASLPALVHAVNKIVSAAELICARLVFCGLFLYGLYKFVSRGG
jgi:hypothetical protein